MFKLLQSGEVSSQSREKKLKRFTISLCLVVLCMLLSVDAYNDPTIESDLSTYDTQYGLPACTTSNGCFTKVDQNGGTNYPRTNSGWALEISLDVETAHEICQTCKIVLVEATTNSLSNLAAAVNQAAKQGATEISNSYGGSESSGETTYDSSYNHSGTAVTASGDGGYGVEYLAASPYVVAVGGTTLNLTRSNTYSSESAWSSAGSGCSAYETANSWQTAVSDWSQTGCGTKRGVADVSADADPNTGAAVYDSTRYQGQPGWFQVGGTSLSSPLIASVFALAGGASSYANAQQIPYTRFTNGMLKQDFRPLLDSAEQKWDRRRYSRSRSSATWNSFHLVSAKS